MRWLVGSWYGGMQDKQSKVTNAPGCDAAINVRELLDCPGVLRRSRVERDVVVHDNELYDASDNGGIVQRLVNAPHLGIRGSRDGEACGVCLERVVGGVAEVEGRCVDRHICKANVELVIPLHRAGMSVGMRTWAWESAWARACA